MEKCGLCKHWWLSDDEKDENIIGMYDMDFEPLPNIDPEVRFCHSPKLLFYVRPNGTQAAVIDGSEYYGRLITTEHFGCVNHEASKQLPDEGRKDS